MQKNLLIQKMLKQPAEFTEADLDVLLRPVNSAQKITSAELTNLTRRIFDVNERSVLNRADAESGVLGMLNRLSRKNRNREYYCKIRRGFRAGPGNKVILAEGDSWFEFPLFISDIIDWLGERPDYAIYSLAYGADWLANIMYQGEYIEGLPVHDPDVFLISGGGNDMVGGNRLTTMLLSPLREKHKIADPPLAWQQQVKQSAGSLADEIIEGKRYLSVEFTAFLNVIRLQYELMFSNILTKYPNLMIITHGYDYAIPDDAIHCGWNIFRMHQPVVNRVAGTGKWLFDSMMLKGITDREMQRKIIRTMIYDFNEMLIRIASKPDYQTVYHVDCRGVCSGPGDWYDELHPHSRIFRRIAIAYQKCIDSRQNGYVNQTKEKVIRVLDVGKGH